MNSLPPELFDKILASPILSIRDVLNISETSVYLKQVTEQLRNKLWEDKFIQRWPQLGAKLQLNGHHNWLCCVKNMCQVEKEVLRSITNMKSEKSLFGQPTLESMSVLNMNFRYDYMEQALLNLVFSQTRPTSFTNVYYGKYLLRYLRCIHFQKEIQEFVKNERTEMCKGALLISRWECAAKQTLPEWQNIESHLQQLELHAINLTKTKKKRYSFSLYQQPEEDSELRRKIDAIIQTMFQEWGFHHDNIPDSDKIDWTELKNAYYIEEVFRTRKGKPIILGIILQDLAQRLNLNCKLICLDDKFFLRVHSSKRNSTQQIYVDIENKMLRESDQLLALEPTIYRPLFYDIIQPLYNIATKYEINNYVHPSALLLTKKEDIIDFELNFSRLACIWPSTSLKIADYAISCFIHGKHLHEARKFIVNSMGSKTHKEVLENAIQGQCLTSQLASIRRRRHVGIRYAVGMCVYVRYGNGDQIDYRLCVIFAWDPYCTNGTQAHPINGTVSFKEPFYSIIKDDGTIDYVPQGQIAYIDPFPKEIDDPKIGIHFDSFNGSFYVGNAEKKKTYPEDEEENRHYYNNLWG